MSNRISSGVSSNTQPASHLHDFIGREHIVTAYWQQRRETVAERKGWSADSAEAADEQFQEQLYVMEQWHEYWRSVAQLGGGQSALNCYSESFVCYE